MAIQVKHTKNLTKADGLDNTVVQPSDWNASHTMTAAAGKVLGTAPGSTTVSELPLEIDTSGNMNISGTFAISSNKGTAGQALLSNGPTLPPSWGSIGVAAGGTGASSITGLVKGNGTSAFTAAVAGTDYVTPANLTSALSPYATTSSVTTALSPYALTSTVNAQIAAIVPGGFTFLGSVATTSGTSQPLSVSLSGYSFIAVTYNGVSGTNGAVSTFQINGVTFATTASAGGTTSGTFWIELLQGYCTLSVQGPGSSFIAVGTNVPVTSGTSTLTFSVTVGSFDAGSIAVYGVK